MHEQEEQITHSNNHASKRKSVNNTQTTKLIAGIALVLIIGIGGFVGGMQYQKSKSTTTTTASASGFGSQNSMGGPSGGFSRNGGFGSVTAISATSITISERRTSTTKTYTIDSSTTITNSGATATYSDIKVGDSVIIRTASTTSTTATEISLNPSMDGPGGPSTNASGTSSDGSQSTSTNGSDSSSI